MPSPVMSAVMSNPNALRSAKRTRNEPRDDPQGGERRRVVAVVAGVTAGPSPDPVVDERRPPRARLQEDGKDGDDPDRVARRRGDGQRARGRGQREHDDEPGADPANQLDEEIVDVGRRALRDLLEAHEHDAPEHEQERGDDREDDPRRQPRPQRYVLHIRSTPHADVDPANSRGTDDAVGYTSIATTSRTLIR
jgi:hypothetical protein